MGWAKMGQWQGRVAQLPQLLRFRAPSTCSQPHSSPPQRTLAQRERVCERDGVCDARDQHHRANVAQAGRQLGGQAHQVVLLQWEV